MHVHSTRDAMMVSKPLRNFDPELVFVGDKDLLSFRNLFRYLPDKKSIATSILQVPL